MSVSSSGLGGLAAKDGEEYYRNLLESSWREKKQLKERLETLERENRDLRRSVYELSIRKSSFGSQNHTFDIDAALQATIASVADTNASTNMDSSQTMNTSNASSFSQNASQSILQTGSSRNFTWKFDLSGHTGAVYTTRFSPCGQMIASGSFDRSVRVWSVEKPADGALYTMLDAHISSVCALAWSPDSSVIFSGGFDRAVREWDAGSSRTSALNSFQTNGCVLCVDVSQRNPDMIYAGTSRNAIYCFDRRISSSKELPSSPKLQSDQYSFAIQNDAMVNSVCALHDGTRLISGDHNGAIKIWDIRKLSESSEESTFEKTPTTPILIVYNDKGRRPISHIHISPTRDNDQEGRFLATNSYDNYIRVYDRGAMLLGSNNDLSLKPLHALKGPQNRSWPIQSSFFIGARFQPVSEKMAATRRSPDDLDDDEDPSGTVGRSDARGVRSGQGVGANGSVNVHRDGEGLTQSSGGRLSRTEDTNIQAALMLASGSADSNAYVFDVSSRTSGLVQVLRGHSDRVYCANFHPSEPVLATCSADHLVKIWAPVKPTRM